MIAAIGSLVAMGCGGHTSVNDGPVDSSVLVEASADAPVEGGADAAVEASRVPDAGEGDAVANPDVQQDDAQEADAGVTCAAGCTTAEQCQTLCPAAFLTLYCCDMTSHTCFIGQDGLQACPLHGIGDASADGGIVGCLPAGCPAGQMCVAYNELDPPEIPIPSCFALAPACASDPTCPCLADAGVCGPDGGGFVPSCDGLDGAAISCNGL